MTHVGELTFDVPHMRGDLYPNALDRGTRTEWAFNLTPTEIYVQGLWTRKVIHAALGLTRAGYCDMFFLMRATERVREGRRLIDGAVLVAVGITADGKE